MSTIRGTASDLTTIFERRFIQISERISNLEVDVKAELADLRGEMKLQKADHEAELAWVPAAIHRAELKLAMLIIGLAGLAATGVFG